MKYWKYILVLLLIVCTVIGFFAIGSAHNSLEDRIISYTADPRTQDLKFYWKDDREDILHSFSRLKQFTESHREKLVFAMNGGMFTPSHAPQGLYIENGQLLASLDTTAGQGNFYLKPNGVFYLTTDRQAVICTTDQFSNDGQVQYATQSGPMLLMDGEYHPALKKGSTNLHIRNGVGILPDGRVVFALSKTEINFYDLASFFKDLGCEQALYLDGFVSRMYLPEKDWRQLDGDFGVMIGVTKPE
ncbi:Uncharacterized protein YigE, DUF2233 family [Catalinimonas alkaloidigena]|uniref:Uncharacterized protein YigE, DUF2233 family n=1 Tax=Catalinimonas alkaloidigena TaxID=1075417 RepID=A0A1G9AEZ6_9BACT|nr:phosphodiester glycosidase family protein [Catalinimonas alkaloidigena]SDK25937.1 Uncharacterized protein YigE, DUF2233 family [Catalinimonas alkaloidigena]